jgi:hypothetical protein
MAGFARGFRGIDGNIFVSQKLWHLSYRQGVDVLLLHRLRGVVKSRLNVVLLQVVVVLEKENKRTFKIRSRIKSKSRTMSKIMTQRTKLIARSSA